ncbi:glycosyltransferase family 22 protein [Macrolepiota fuliginosa MF-IS2]|uniref:Mannosyltransferase n=1 Tax=Macrolepiota fuliginosa MF-IS2 TaxID=1400762 RepID=A0A9P5XJ02_9AGAR|nr:glycosyltransferase family 22 protein [Macrolepiota fuliginosa MF-IS2]
MSSTLDALFFIFGWAYVLLAPYTKVEESFNIQATHDILTHGVSIDQLKNFDHFVFSGPVPRTFIGSTFLAWTSYPFINVAAYLNLVSSTADLQIIVRLVLATLNAISLSYVRRAVKNRFGNSTAFFFTFLTCSQFHLLFWMGRTLPNMFALPLANIALALLFDRIPNSSRIPEKSWKIALWLFGFSTIVFRVELLLLWALVSLQLLLQDQASLFSILTTNILASATAAATTLIIDSYFWQRMLLPELSSFFFNVAQGQSSNWGVSPFQAYFTVHLPRLLMTGFPIAYIGSVSDPRVSIFLLPYVAFVLLISNLGHKEWRFIIYTVPAFNIAAARGLRYLTSRRKASLFGQISLVAALGALAANFALTGLLVRTSMFNYPGGTAIAAFHQLLPAHTAPPPHVHICNLAAQSGTTLFQHLNSPPFHPALFLWPNSVPPAHPWTYNKTENLTIADLSNSRHFTHLISEVPPTEPEIIKYWRLIKSIPAFDRVVLDKELLLRKPLELPRRVWDLIRVEEKEQLWIYERSDSVAS